MTNVSGRIGLVRFLRGLKSANEGQDIDKEHLETRETYMNELGRIKHYEIFKCVLITFLKIIFPRCSYFNL